MVITDNTKLKVEGGAQAFLINVTTGTLVTHINVDGLTFDYPIATYSEVFYPANSVITFTLTGDTATINRV
jgi:hypothetical protein